MWQLEFELPKTTAIGFQEAMAEVFETMLIFESEDKSNWVIRLIFEEEPSDQVYQQIQILGQEFQQPLPEIKTEKLPEIDWLAENRKDFPAMTIANFYIHGSHLPGIDDPSLIPIQVDASLAFGTGEHATTRGCLEMIAEMPQPAQGVPILDLGCGTAILAIAMAKLWNRPIWASDIDEDSIPMARQNCLDNGVEGFVQVLHSDGFAHKDLQQSYGLIVANILAGPLCELAPQMKQRLMPQGRVLLSGLLAEQKDLVQKTYEQNGFKLLEDKIIGEWATLYFEAI